MLPVPVPMGYFPQLFSQHKIELSSFHCLWDTLVNLYPACCPGRNLKSLPTQTLTGCGVWKQHEMRYLADDSAFFPPEVYPVRSYSI